MKKLSLCAFILVFSVGLLYARTESQDSVKYRFNPVVVTATKIAGVQKDIAASVSVIDEKLIENSVANSVFDLVTQNVPGVFISERAVMGYGVSSGAAGGISIRGIGGSPVTGVLVLRDGRPDIMGMMGHPIPDAYSLDGVERIEVVRGPASFLYGTNAMGGVINIVSKRSTEDGFNTQVSAGMGSFDTRNYRIAHGGKSGIFEYHVTAGRNETDGHREESDYEGDFYTAHFGLNLNPATQIEFNANLTDLYLLDPGTETTPYVDHWYDLQRSGADVTISHSGKLGDSYLKMHGNFGDHKIYDGWRSKDHTIGVMFYQNMKLFKGNGTTIGFDIKQYGGDAEDSVTKSPYLDYTEKNVVEYAPYIHTQQLFYERFILSGGVRFEKHELYGSEILPKAGLVYHINNSTSVRLSAAKGFRSPSIRELYVMPPRNEELEPERMWNYEIGLSKQLYHWLNIETALFRSKGSNLIQMQGLPMQFVNTGEFDHTGYEVSVNCYPVEKLILSASWSKLDLQDETLNSPGKKLTTYVAYDWLFARSGFNFIYVRDLYGDNNHQNPMSNYSLLNIFTSFNLTHGVGLKFSVKNALDKEYQTMWDCPMPGRYSTMELIYNF